MNIVHEGRCGHIDIGGRHYNIEHIEGGLFAIHFQCGHRHRGRDADLTTLLALVQSDPHRWMLEDRSRRVLRAA